MTVLQAVILLLEDLERVSQEHEEVTDTDVRESLHLAVNYYFVWGREQSRLPCCFGMFSAEGDALVSQAIRRFLSNVTQARDLSAIPPGQSRLDSIQVVGARTAGGMLYDEFLGSRDVPLPPDPIPEHLFQPGEYDDETDE